MPTFQSIGVSEDLQRRLTTTNTTTVSAAQHHQDGSSLSSIHNNNNNNLINKSNNNGGYIMTDSYTDRTFTSNVLGPQGKENEWLEFQSHGKIDEQQHLQYDGISPPNVSKDATTTTMAAAATTTTTTTVTTATSLTSNPQALLSRTPQALLQLLNTQTSANNSTATSSTVTTMAQCDEIRRQIAKGMILQTKMGKWNEHIHNSNCEYHRKQRELQQEVVGYHMDTTTTTNAINPPLLFGATTSVWQTLQFQNNCNNHHDTTTAITTNGVGSTCSNHPLSYLSSWSPTQPPITMTTTGCEEIDNLLQLSSTTTTTISTAKGDISLLGHVLQISGPSACGKTLFALQMALEMALLGQPSSLATSTTTTTTNLGRMPTPPFQVVYLASRAGHSIMGLAHRLYHLVQERCNPSNNDKHHGSSEYFHSQTTTTTAATTCLDDIAFHSVSNGYQLLQELAHLEDRLWQEQQQPTSDYQEEPFQQQSTTSASSNRRLGMIVIDSIYQMHMVHRNDPNHGTRSNTTNEGTPTATTSSSPNTNTDVLLQVGHVLKRLARQYSIAIVVTNGVVVNQRKQHTKLNTPNTAITNPSAAGNPTTNYYKPALGTAWHHVAVDLHLLLQPLPSQPNKNWNYPMMTQDHHHDHLHHVATHSSSTSTVAAILKQHVNIVCHDDDEEEKYNRDNTDNTTANTISNASNGHNPKLIVYLRFTKQGLQGIPLRSEVATTSDDYNNSHNHNQYTQRHQYHHHQRHHDDEEFLRTPQQQQQPPTKRSRPTYHHPISEMTTPNSKSG